MAKQTTEKKEFAWDTEKLIGEFESTNYRNEVRICTLNSKPYVSMTKYIKSTKEASGWKRTKNNTMLLEDFKELQVMVSKWESEEQATDAAYGRVEKPKAKKEKAPMKAKKEEPKEEKPKRTKKAASK